MIVQSNNAVNQSSKNERLVAENFVVSGNGLIATTAHALDHGEFYAELLPESLYAISVLYPSSMDDSHPPSPHVR